MAGGVGEDHLQLGVFGALRLDPGGPDDPHQPRLQLIKRHRAASFFKIYIYNLQPHCLHLTVNMDSHFILLAGM